MRIAINALFLVPNRVGGSETYLRGLVRGLDRLDSTDQFALIVGPEAAPTFSGLSSRWRVVASPVRSGKRAQRMALEQTWLPMVARRFGANVLHSTGYTAPMMPTLPSVVSIHDMNYRRHPEDLSLAERLVYAALIPQAARWHDRVMTLSSAARADIVRWTPARPDKVVVVPGAPREDWPGDPADDQARLAAVGVRCPFVLSVAAAYPHKNIERLVLAFPLDGGPDQDQEVQLVLVGLKGRAAPAIEAAVRSRVSVVRSLGWVDDALLGSLYRNALALAFPSLYEGFGLPILEAMALGTPVLTSNYGATAELADGAAELVDPRSVEAIGAGLRRITADADHRAELRRLGLGRASQFSWDATAQRTCAVYTSLLAERRQS